jgi:acyl-CoA thioester hydrolase
MSFPAPFIRYEVEVLPAWIDGNNHMNMGYYVVMFDLATDELWDELGIGRAYKLARRCGTFAVEAHIIYDEEMLLGERGHVHSRVIGHDAKRLHVAHELYRARDGKRAAAQEFLFLNVDLDARKVVPWPADILAKLVEAEAAHATLPPLAWTGRRIALPARVPA